MKCITLIMLITMNKYINHHCLVNLTSYGGEFGIKSSMTIGFK